MLFYIWLLYSIYVPKNLKITVYFICIFTLLYLFVLLLVVRLFLFSLFLFDSIVLYCIFGTLNIPNRTETVTLKPWYKPNREKV